MSELQGIVVVGAIIAAALLLGPKASTLKNKVPVDEGFPRFHLFKGVDDGDGTLEVSGDLNGRTGSFAMDRGMLYGVKPSDPGYIDSLHLKFTPDYYLVAPGLDLGTWGGYREAGKGTSTDTFQVGLRVSPARLLFDTVAPDLVISRDTVGAGLSAYPPERWSTLLHHVGLGAWYTVPLDGSRDSGPSGWCYGLSFSTH